MCGGCSSAAIASRWSGDGVNDGPVLARADVSIAMGQAVPLAQAKADFVVLGGQLAAVRVAAAACAAHARASCGRTWPGPPATTPCACRWPCSAAMPPWLAGLGMAASSLLVVANSRAARWPIASRAQQIDACA